MTTQQAIALNAWFWNHPLTEITASGWYRFGGVSCSEQRLLERAERLAAEGHLERAERFVGLG